MDIRTIVDEPKRGCGFRKEGGLYLVAGGPSAPCGKLPLELSVCPCCGQGIKPARGWTWVDGRKLFEGVECNFDGNRRPTGARCPDCILDFPPERMGLLWIGEKYYSTPEEFLAEGQALGLSRRISAIPNDFELGKTWVLFAHRKAIVEKVEYRPGLDGADVTGATRYSPGIFSCFLPQRIEYIIKDDDTKDKLERLEKRGITLVRLLRSDNQAEMFPSAGEERDDLEEPWDATVAQQELEELDRNQILSDIYDTEN